MDFRTLDNKSRVEKNPELKRDEEHVAAFGKLGQALIGGYDIRFVKENIVHETFKDLKKFQDSKPKVNKDSIYIYSYRMSLKSNPKYDCVWYKFKSPEVINSVLKLPTLWRPVDPKTFMAFAFDEARRMAPEEAKAVDEVGYRFVFDSLDLKTGYSWINSEITLEKKNNEVHIVTPTLITNKHVPIFGGMTYCKVFTPKDAVKILGDLAKGDFDRKPSVQNLRGRRFKFD